METKGFDRKRKGEEGRLGMINRLNYFIFVYENITMKNSALYTINILMRWRWSYRRSLNLAEREQESNTLLVSE